GGKALFELLYYAKGNGPEGERHSVRNPSSAEMQGIASGWKIWADVLGPTAANREACTVDVVMEADVGNARCGSDIEDPDGGMTLLGEAIVNGSPDRGSAFMGLGVVTEPGSPAPVPPHTPYGEIYSTTVHEAGHGLGLTSSIGSTPIGKTPLLSILDSHLFSKGTGGELRLRDVKDISQVVRVVKDEKGTTYYLPRAVDMPGGGKAYSWTRQVQAGDLPEGAFLVGELSNSGVFFSGPETTTTLNAHGDSGLPGVRIEGFESNDKDSTGSYVYTPDLSHLELAHSMMSHQNYRNYNFFMEAELAVLKDLGYRIDLKRFYGASIYGNNLNVVNDAPFYARRSDGRGWLEGQPSEETFGVGLHVYGEHNSVLQRADLLTKGEAAVGVRIDGARTTLGIPAGVRVHADGTNGAGLLVAYGRDTEIAVLGEIRARGEGGVAARFDFGGNYIGDKAEIRGSYMHRVPDEMGQLKEGPLKGTDDAGYQLHLDGPLVKTFNVAGELEGSAAAIYMSENAFVQEINILTGAAVSGDIISHWDAKNPLLQAKKDSLYTSLVFGRKRGNGGEAGEPDRDFDMTLEGSIDGPKGIDMELRAGRLIVEGETHVHNMTNSGWLGVTGLKSTLVGTVSGSFTQTKDGVLQSWVTPDGTSTNLQASGGSAQGRWAVTPDKGYWVHRKAVPLTNAPVFFGDGTKTAFSGSLLAESSSLTLAFGLLDASGSRPVIGAFRAADAYSRLATRDSGA
ncbi:MAG: hypothetical protein K6E40_11240, partial [Desulfovibrio sp.]|nr:hypothetical protein [Desulfovibrio sp.]